MIKTSIVFTIFVILCSFASNSETKDFCDSFKDNDYKIDYTSEYKPYFPDSRIRLLVVIGNEYWIIKINGSDTLEFMSRQSRYHGESVGRYSAAFLRDHFGDDEVNLVGFIMKNRKTIEWKTVNNVTNNCSLFNCIYIGDTGPTNTDLSLPDGFTPSATFVLVTHNRTDDSYVKYVAFVDQRPDSRDSSLFTRRYVVQSVPKDQLFPDLTLKSVYNKTFTEMNDLIIGTMAHWDQGWDFPFIIYSRKGDILYCFLDGFDSGDSIDTMFNMTFNECSDREIVIQCPFMETTPKVKTTPEVRTSTEVDTNTKDIKPKNYSIVWITIILLSLIVLMFVVSLVTLLWFCLKKEENN